MTKTVTRLNFKDYAQEGEVVVSQHANGLLIDIHYNAVLCDEKEAHELIFKLLKQSRAKWGDGFLLDTQRTIELML